MTSLTALDVDGERPAVRWVTSLPQHWLTAADRHVLLVLALDTYAKEPPFTAAPSTAELMQWTGEFKGTLLDRLKRLASAVPDVRPELLEVTLGSGRRRSRYELLVKKSGTWATPASDKQRGDHDERLSTQAASGRAEQTASSGRATQTTTSRSGLRSGLGCGRAEPTTPLPLPLVVPPSSPLADSSRPSWEEEAIAFLTRSMHVEEDTAAELWDLAKRDPNTRSPAGRIRSAGYRAELTASLERLHSSARRRDAHRHAADQQQPVAAKPHVRNQAINQMRREQRAARTGTGS